MLIVSLDGCRIQRDRFAVLRCLDHCVPSRLPLANTRTGVDGSIVAIANITQHLERLLFKGHARFAEH